MFHEQFENWKKILSRDIFIIIPKKLIRTSLSLWDNKAICVIVVNKFNLLAFLISQQVILKVSNWPHLKKKELLGYFLTDIRSFRLHYNIFVRET